MEGQENTSRSSSNISTKDILKALDSFGERANLPAPTADQAKAINRDSGVSESCSSFISSDRPVSITSDGLSVVSDSEQLPEFTSDVISDPLGVCSSTCTSDGEGDNEFHYFDTKPWDEKLRLERECKLLFESENFFSELSQHALEGKLQHSKFRSIAWKLFLDCLPEDQKEWISKTQQLRHEYETFKQKNLIDPTKEDAERLDILHPLSLDESSPWKQYFKDNELKALIKQDLHRLYPEIEFFCSLKVKEMMLNLLFCYAKKNEALGYKQGMHELLAPIVYVLECDSKSHTYMDGDALDVIRCVIDPAYVEHDAFAMFCQLMEVTEVWYQHHQKSQDSKTNSKFVANSEPFAERLTAPPTAIIKKLNKIQDHLLRKHDTDLWFHLKELNIVPQVYGLRWIRLLFSREFPFQGVLVIWDALLAEGSHLDLVEYFYIVMLQAIRNKLMAGNYATCMSFLMKFPHVHDDVHVYVKRAINLRGTKKSRPNSRTLQTKTPTFFSAQGSNNVESSELLNQWQMFQKPAGARPKSALSRFTERYTSGLVESKLPGLPSNVSEQDHAKGGQSKEMIHKLQKGTKPDPLSSPPSTRDHTEPMGSTPGRTMKSLGNELKTKFTRPRSRSRQGNEELEKDHQRLQIQVSHLNDEVERMQSLYLYCGRKLDSYIGLLQEEVTKDGEADRDVVYLSLAGLKQVRDLLKGTLAYRATSDETEKDFVDIDKGIATRLQISFPNIPGEQIREDIPVPILGDDKHENTNSNENPIPQCSATSVEQLDSLGNDSQQGGHGSRESVTEQEIPASHASNDRTECDQKSLKKHQFQNLHESRKTNNGSSDHCGDKELSDIPRSKLSTSSSPAICALDSYLEEHFSNSKEPVGITTVPCTTGSSTNNPLQTSNGTNHGNDSRDTTKGSENHLKKGSNISSPEETLEKEFVFVNEDGTARSTHASPRLSPTHPLETNDDDDY